jgi:hypothetical protein
MNYTEYLQVRSAFPERDFCFHSSKEGNKFIVCGKEADSVNRNNSVNFSVNYRCSSCLEAKQGKRWISVEKYLDGNTGLCSYSSNVGIYAGLLCGLPAVSETNIWKLRCVECAHKDKGIGSDILFNQLLKHYREDNTGLKVHSNKTISKYFGDNFFICNQIDLDRSALIEFERESNTIKIYGLFNNHIGPNNPITLGMLKRLIRIYEVDIRIAEGFNVICCDIKPKIVGFSPGTIVLSLVNK